MASRRRARARGVRSVGPHFVAQKHTSRASYDAQNKESGEHPDAALRAPGLPAGRWLRQTMGAAVGGAARRGAGRPGARALGTKCGPNFSRTRARLQSAVRLCRLAHLIGALAEAVCDLRRVLGVKKWLKRGHVLIIDPRTPEGRRIPSVFVPSHIIGHVTVSVRCGAIANHTTVALIKI